jgi:hypothetical protein
VFALVFKKGGKYKNPVPLKGESRTPEKWLPKKKPRVPIPFSGASPSPNVDDPRCLSLNFMLHSAKEE